MNTWGGDVVDRGRARMPLVVAGGLTAVTALLAWQGSRELSLVPSFVPSWLVLIIAFDLMTVTLLTQQYRVGGNPRLLALSWAYAWSGVLTVATVVTMGESVTVGGSINTISDASIWLLLARVVGGPVFIVVGLVPWADRFDAWLRNGEGRTRRAVATDVGVVAGALALVALVLERPIPLPAITRRVDGVPVLLDGVVVVMVASTAALLVAGVCGMVVRRRMQGLEAWALVALAASAGGTVLTAVSAAPYDVAWYGARGLGLAATFMVLLGLLHDVNHLQTKVRGYARRLEQQNHELTEAQGVRDHLVAVVSHDMRNPLAGIAGYLEVLRDDPDLTAADIHRIHTRARLLTRRLTLMTEDLLASSSAQDVAVVPRRLALRDVLDECAAGFPDLDVITRCPVDLDLEADALRLQQVLANLVGNAARYGAQPVRITAVRYAGSARIAVSDAGPGVPVDFVPRLFERYTRADPERSRGSGLGLALSRQLVERHGGTLDYDPETQEFVVLLPALSRQRAGETLAPSDAAVSSTG